MRMPSFLNCSLCILVLLLGIQRLCAQSEITIGQYTEQLPYYNVAALGLKNEVVLSALHNRQLEGIEASAKSFIVMGDMPIKLLNRRHGLGVQLDNKSFGIFRDAGLSARYAFRWHLAKAGILQIGAGLRLQSSSIDGSRIFIPGGIEGSSPTDEALPTGEVAGRGLDVQLGVFYRYDNLDVGVGINNLLNSRIILNNKYVRELSRSYTFYTCYRIGKEQTTLIWEPSLLFTIDTNALYRLDLKVGAWYHQRFYAAALYRPLQALGVNLGIKLGKMFLGYQFESPTNELRHGTWGNHELLISYTIVIDIGEKRNKRYKSIRLL